MSNNEKLSQSEIDTLLKGEHKLTPEQSDAIGEIGNISLGSASTPMSQLLQRNVGITTPRVSVKSADDMDLDFGDEYLRISIEYTQGLEGDNVLIVRGDDARRIANLMLGGDGTDISGELDELHLSAVGEIMNQMMGSAATSMSTFFKTSVNISPPQVELRQKSEDGLGLEGWYIVVEFQLTVEDLIDSALYQLVPYNFGVNMIDGLLQSIKTPPKPEPVATETQENTKQAVAQESPQSPKSSPTAKPSVQTPQFEAFDRQSTSRSTPANLDILMGVELKIHVELGSTRKRIREVLDMAPGAIIELEKLAGEPVDVYINDQKIGFGEVVVIDEKFGVRLTEIVSPQDRIKGIR